MSGVEASADRLRRTAPWAVVIFAASVGLLIATRRGAAGLDAGDAGRVVQAMGFVLLAGWCFGILAERVGGPRLTGYVLAGMLIGPSITGWLDAGDVAALRVFDDLALTFIALVAGGELRLTLLAGRVRSIAGWIAGQVAIVPLVTMAGVVGLAGRIPGLDLRGPEAVAAALVVGVIALARSPAATVAVIDESDARGPFTETTLAVTVVLDTVVVLLFAAATAVAANVVEPGVGFDAGVFAGLGVEIALSVVAGIAVGGVVLLAIRYMHLDLPVLLAALAFLITRIARAVSHGLHELLDVNLHLEPLLIGLTAGIVVRNVSPRGGAFTEALERIAPPIYVLFFTLVGASLDLGRLGAVWPVALVLVVLRTAGLWLGSWIGSGLAGDDPVWRRRAGWTAISQAGVSLGLVAELGRRFPEWGAALAPALVASIAVHQLLGPVLLERALEAVGERGRARVPPPSRG